jgi:hypothetical protein
MRMNAQGCRGVQALFGAKNSSCRFFTQVPGSAMKMSRATFMRSMRSMPAFERLAFAYVQAFIEQLMVSVACNGAHDLKQRLALGPDDLKIAFQAFDHAWAQIAGRFTPDTTEGERMRLATLILSLIPETKDVSEMQAIAVQEMTKSDYN